MQIAFTILKMGYVLVVITGDQIESCVALESDNKQ
jgi:hypothetical protein